MMENFKKEIKQKWIQLKLSKKDEEFMKHIKEQTEELRKVASNAFFCNSIIKKNENII